MISCTEIPGLAHVPRVCYVAWSAVVLPAVKIQGQRVAMEGGGGSNFERFFVVFFFDVVCFAILWGVVVRRYALGWTCTEPRDVSV